MKIEGVIVHKLGQHIFDVFLGAMDKKIDKKIQDLSRKYFFNMFQEKLEENLLINTENEMYYNDLCTYLYTDNHLDKLLKRCYKRDLNDHRTNKELIAEEMKTCNFGIYNESMIKGDIEKILSAAFLAFNDVQNPDIQKVINIMMQETNHINECITISSDAVMNRIEKSDERNNANHAETLSHMNESYANLVTMLQTTKLISDKLVAQEVQMITSDKYEIALTAKKSCDNFCICTEIAVSGNDFVYTNFDEFIRYLRFSGRTKEFEVCKCEIITSDGNILETYEKKAYKGMKISLPTFYVPEYKKGIKDLDDMRVMLSPQLTFIEMEIENELGEVIIPQSKYRIEREKQDNAINVHLIDTANKGRLKVGFDILLFDVTPMKSSTQIKITQKDGTKVISNIEFLNVMAKLARANELIGRNANTNKIVFESSKANLNEKELLDYYDMKINFYRNVLRIERKCHVNFVIPDRIEEDDIRLVQQISDVLEKGITSAGFGEMTIPAKDISLKEEQSLEDFVKEKNLAIMFHYQKIELFGVNLSIWDQLRFVIFADKMRLSENGDIVITSSRNYIYNEQATAKNENHIIDCLASGNMNIG